MLQNNLLSIIIKLIKISLENLHCMSDQPIEYSDEIEEEEEEDPEIEHEDQGLIAFNTLDIIR